MKPERENIAYYENYLRFLAQDLTLPIHSFDGKDINLEDYEHILKVYFHGKIPVNWKCTNCTKCKWCFKCKNCKWCTACVNSTACTKCIGIVNGFGYMFDVAGAKANIETHDIIAQPSKPTFFQKFISPFISFIYTHS